MNAPPARPPRTLAELDRARAASRAMLRRRARTSALASLVPLPGLDLILDIGLLGEVLPRISERFGVAHDDILALDSAQRRLANKAIRNLGPTLVGKVVTKGLLVSAARLVGMRLSARQAAKFVPIVGTAVAAAIGYVVFMYLGNRHIDQCDEVARTMLAARRSGTRLRAPAAHAREAPARLGYSSEDLLPEDDRHAPARPRRSGSPRERTVVRPPADGAKVRRGRLRVR